MRQLTAPELAHWIEEGVANAPGTQPILLDVREPWEFELCHIEGAMLMPMSTVPTRQQELDPDAPIVCICHHGMRSMQVAAFLEQNGFTQMVNLSGGIHAWAQQVDPAMPTY